MAYAQAYDRFDDPGMAFTEDDVWKFDIERVAEDRLLWLIELQNQLNSYNHIASVGGVGARVWSMQAAVDVKFMARYLALAVGIPAPDDADMDLEGEAAKPYILKAHEIEDVSEFAESLSQETLAHIRRVVTLARRQNSRFKSYRSKCNKYINQLLNQKSKFDAWAKDVQKYNLKSAGTTE